MYNYQDCGETKKEQLTADDIDAICSIYPLAKTPNTCVAPAPEAGGCCDAGAGSPAGSALLGLLLVTRMRKTRRRR
jgi:hypothetical protein